MQQSADEMQSKFANFLQHTNREKRQLQQKRILEMMLDTTIDHFYKGIVFLRGILRSSTRAEAVCQRDCEESFCDKSLINEREESAFLEALKECDMEWFILNIGKTRFRYTNGERLIKDVVKITSRNKPVMFLNVGRRIEIGHWADGMFNALVNGSYLINRKSRNICFKDRRLYEGNDVPMVTGKFTLPLNILQDLYQAYRTNIHQGLQQKHWPKVQWKNKNYNEVDDGYCQLKCPIEKDNNEDDDSDIEDIDDIAEVYCTTQAYCLES